MKLSAKNNFNLKKRIKRFFVKHRGKYYGQNGEDIIVYNLLRVIKPIDKVLYLDIGCGSPKFLSNTYYLYQKGARGWCVDANYSLKQKYKRSRKHDKFLNLFIDNISGETRMFYKINMPELNTASSEISNYLTDNGFKIMKKYEIKTTSFQNLLREEKIDKIDFLNIDIEGKDFELLKSMDLNNFRPYVVCIEAVDFDSGENSSDTKEIIDYMTNYDYVLSANTKVNLIFVDKKGEKYEI